MEMLVDHKISLMDFSSIICVLLVSLASPEQ